MLSFIWSQKRQKLHEGVKSIQNVEETTLEARINTGLSRMADGV